MCENYEISDFDTQKKNMIELLDKNSKGNDIDALIGKVYVNTYRRNYRLADYYYKQALSTAQKASTQSLTDKEISMLATITTNQGDNEKSIYYHLQYNHKL